MNNLYVVNVIIPATRSQAQRTLQTKRVAPDETTARRMAVTNCRQAEGTMAYGEIVKCFPPLVGASLPSKAAPVVARRHPSLQEGGRRPRRNVVAPKVQAKRIPPCPVPSSRPDSMSFAEAAVILFGDTTTEVEAIVAEARKAAAEIAADIDAEMFPTTASNFLAGVGSAYDVEAEGWTGWKAGVR